MLEVGFGQATITPPLGTPLGGYEERRFNALGIHDDLHARCILFKDTVTGLHVAIIACELLWVNYEFSDGVKALVEKFSRGAIKKEHVIVHAIHTHSSQRIVPGLDFYYKPIPRKHDIDRGWYVKHAIPYLQRVIASTVHGALHDLRPATILGGEGTTDAGFNRREGDDAARVVDRALSAMVILEKDGRATGSNVRGILYNLACHCVAMGQENYLVSADWPFFTEQLVRDALHLPRGTSVVFAQGTSGNTNPFNCRFGNETREVQDAEDVGVQVAADLLKVLRPGRLKALLPRDGGDGAKGEGDVNGRDGANGGDGGDGANGEGDINGGDGKPALEMATREFRVEVTDPKKVAFYKEFGLWFIGVEEDDDGTLFLKIRIHAIKIGKLMVVAVPGEPFGEFGVKIREMIRELNPDALGMVMELTDGAVGYITTRDSYYNAKGYEANLAGSAETGYAMLDNVRELLREMAG